ncbi:hypothetical protein [Streptomyces sp. NPDC048603]|uniref:hypothetical protein n=1 Tax=Streptomyces sp. NPDC048603 TaxID=3365577 RepID=UPI003720CE40
MSAGAANTRDVMRGTGRWAVLAAAGAVLMVAGCGEPHPGAGAGAGAVAAASPLPGVSPSAGATPGGGAPAPPAGVSGRQAVEADLRAAAVAAGVAEPEALPTVLPSGKAAEFTAHERDLLGRMLNCMVTLGEGGGSPSAPGPDAAQFEAAVTALTGRGWTQTDRTATPVGRGGDFTQVRFGKNGWTLFARRAGFDGWSSIQLTATELACEKQFTDEEMALLDKLGDRDRDRDRER